MTWLLELTHQTFLSFVRMLLSSVLQQLVLSSSLLITLQLQSSKHVKIKSTNQRWNLSFQHYCSKEIENESNKWIWLHMTPKIAGRNLSFILFPESSCYFMLFWGGIDDPFPDTNPGIFTLDHKLLLRTGAIYAHGGQLCLRFLKHLLP